MRASEMMDMNNDDDVIEAGYYAILLDKKLIKSVPPISL